MRMTIPLFIAAVFAAPSLWAQDAFDACEVFTQADAEAALGTTAAPEPVNPKVKRNPKAPIPTCKYDGFKDGKTVAAIVTFKSGKAESEVQKAFDEHRLAVQTKPMLISGAEAFWSGKTGQMNLRKGKTWIQLSVGVEKVTDRDPDQAKKLAMILERKIQ
ncbi:hypothetical protein [Usitatibacter palustris]|uniref:DUF3558 domain-containing protein n=1 Tax=Usitatibacter palustris TaxID=2732487 RepID=A0A6M4H8R5_9PROT|nr:hypothetical protein [Usitatibacter palustris]QJR16006.1 hypothetical protein DSM104440_02834 [Usitatibacter palustris]